MSFAFCSGWSMRGRLGVVALVTLGSSSTWIEALTVAIGMLAVLAIVEPMEAQSDQGLLLSPACDTRVNLQHTFTSDATFSFGARHTSAVASSDAIGLETEAPTLTSPSNPFAILRKSWGEGGVCSDSFSKMKPLAQSGESYPDTAAEGHKPSRDSTKSSSLIV